MLVLIQIVLPLLSPQIRVQVIQQLIVLNLTCGEERNYVLTHSPTYLLTHSPNLTHSLKVIVVKDKLLMNLTKKSKNRMIILVMQQKHHGVDLDQIQVAHV